MADLRQLGDNLLSRRSLILGSNRGPVEHYLTAEGRLAARRGNAGIVTALNGLAQTAPFTWISNAMGEGDRRIAGQDAPCPSPLPGHRINLRYVVTPRRVYHKYYNVLCNPLLWFLQHYLWHPPYNPNVDAAVHDAWENGYRPVNQAFARQVAEQARQNDRPPVVMGHDYHLYLLPEYARQEMPDAIIQHYIHIPWPTPRYWQLIPSYISRQICAALCCADILGFQTPQDRRSFLDTVEELLPAARVDRADSLVHCGGRVTRVRVYPLSINPGEVRRIAAAPRARAYAEQLRAAHPGAIIVRIDRAEPNKNVVRGFRAYELLLSRHPELVGQVSFLAFLVPSRTHLRQYQRYLEEIKQVVAQINRDYGTADWQPIALYLENNYTQAVAGMKLYDALLVNTLMEGMNLVAKEGPVVNARDGVLILSESSGAYHQLREGALPVAPADGEGTMQALYQALTMPPEERKRRAALLAAAVGREDINQWICRQIEDISELL